MFSGDYHLPVAEKPSFGGEVFCKSGNFRVFTQPSAIAAIGDPHQSVSTKTVSRRWRLRNPLTSANVRFTQE